MAEREGGLRIGEIGEGGEGFVDAPLGNPSRLTWFAPQHLAPDISTIDVGQNAGTAIEEGVHDLRIKGAIAAAPERVAGLLEAARPREDLDIPRNDGEANR